MSNEDRATVEEYSQIEAIQIVKSLMAKYPTDKQDSASIIFNTIENSLALILVGTEGKVKDKDILRSFSKNVLAKTRAVKENIKLEKEKLSKVADSRS